jgi:hypothetical protein
MADGLLVVTESRRAGKPTSGRAAKQGGEARRPSKAAEPGGLDVAQPFSHHYWRLVEAVKSARNAAVKIGATD